jgi:hypothetical protein
MRPVSFGPLRPGAGADEKLDWIIRSLREIETASVEDAIAVFDSYGADVPPTTTRQVNVTTPAASNLAAVLASLIADMRKRGVKKTS